nr:hypothetical protein [Tanacetum cinerariifolium]
MLDRIDFASWQQRIRLYCRGKENGVNILKSINEGPYQLRTIRETLAKITVGAPQFGPEQPQVYSDLTPEEKDRSGDESMGLKCSWIWGSSEQSWECQSESSKTGLSKTGKADECNAFDSDVDEAPTVQTMFIANLSSADPITDEARPSYDSDILSKALTKKIKEIKDVFEELEAEVAQYAVDRKHDAIERKNLLIATDNLIPECLSKEVFFVATNSELIVARFIEMNVAHTIVEARCLALEAELANLRDKSHHDNQEELINRFSKLEVNHLDLLLKYQNLKDGFGNNLPPSNKDTPDFDSVFVIGKMQASLQGKDNVIRQLKKQISQLQVTRKDADRTLKVQTADSQITKLTEQITNLQAQNNLFRAKNDKIKQHHKELKDQVKSKVFAQGKHAIDVTPIFPRLRNNKDAHLDYLMHLNESVETIHDIVEEAKFVRPLDRSIVSACRYTKHSQELLEYAIGTCPQGSQQRAKQLAHIPLIRKKQVTFAKPSDKSDSNTHQHVVTVKPQNTNVPVPPST